MKQTFIFLIITLAACQTSESSFEGSFYDLKGFVGEQIEVLQKDNPTVNKLMIINDQKEEKEFMDIDWTKEFELLLQCDLNKSAYALSYDVAEANLTETYILKAGEDLPVKTLQITKDEKGNVLRIAADMATENYLFQSKKHLEYDFINRQLKNYQIEGTQSLIIGGEKSFKIVGKVS